jgi:hypothetical protein
VKTIVAAFHSDLPRGLQQGLLHRRDLQLCHVRSLPELLERIHKGTDVCLLGPQLGEQSAVTVAQQVRAQRATRGLPLILLLPTAGHAALPHTTSFDEVVEWPAKANSLPPLLAKFLGLPVRLCERYPVRVHVFGSFGQGGEVAHLGTSIDLSLDGMLLRTGRAATVGERVLCRFALPGRPLELQIHGKVVRLEKDAYAPDSGVAIRFDAASAPERQQLKEHFAAMSGRTFRWNIVREGQRLQIHLSGVLNAEVDLTALKQLRGELDFYLRDFRRISSDSIQTWLDLMRALTGVAKIRLHECPIAFVQQANAISNLLDNTDVVSFFAPYLCPRCGLDEEQMICVDRDLRDPSGQILRRPPTVKCVSCSGEMTFDDIPERYFMFL